MAILLAMIPSNLVVLGVYYILIEYSIIYVQYELYFPYPM